jgi:hypothetical protein
MLVTFVLFGHWMEIATRMRQTRCGRSSISAADGAIMRDGAEFSRSDGREGRRRRVVRPGGKIRSWSGRRTTDVDQSLVTGESLPGR